MSFVGEAAGARGLLGNCPAIAARVARFQDRAAWRRALERGGPYRFSTSRTPSDSPADGGELAT